MAGAVAAAQRAPVASLPKAAVASVTTVSATTTHSDTDYGLYFSPARGWLGSRVVGVLDSGAEGPGFKSQPRRCRVTVLGKLFTPIVPLLTKQRKR